MKRKRQTDRIMYQSIERRLSRIERHLILYPASPDLLYYMLTEMDLFREDVSIIRETSPHGIMPDELFKLQIQVTSLETEIYDRLSKATEVSRSSTSVLT